MSEIKENETQLDNDVQNQILEKEKEIVKLKNEKASIITRSLAVHEKNTLLMSSEDIQRKIAILEYEEKVMDLQLKRAAQFAASRAFPTNTPEQCYVLMRAGQEMGLSEIVSMNMLYVVNGHINPYGDKMLGYILSRGYSVQYIDESEKTVTVRIYNDEQEYIETASVTDQIIKKSMIKGAASFALKNKLRFHAIRMIASFHLPHLFMGCGDNFSPDFDKWSDDEEMKIKDVNGNTVLSTSNDDLLEKIRSITEPRQVIQLEASEDYSQVVKDFNLVDALGAKKIELGL